MIENPIFIIGTERSGSNLLRLVLNAHSHISIPHPPHIMRDFSPIVSKYGDLENKVNFNQLLNDIIEIVNHHFSPWPYTITKDLLLPNIKSNTLYDIYNSLYESYRVHQKKMRWGCKSTFMHQEIVAIINFHKAPRFIHLVRDPRDIAVSASQSIFSKFHPYKMAELWKAEQNNIERWAYLKDQGMLKTVRYEDLTENPIETIKEIMFFLNESFEEEQLNFFKDKEAKKLASLSKSWQQVEKPINTKSVGQFKNKLSDEDIGLIELLCGDLMKKYNYLLVAHKENLKNPSVVKILAIESFEHVAKLKTEMLAIRTDKNFYMRWHKKILLKKMELIQRIHF
jgi:uncharacterized protein YejL (UPF0352 family)